MITWYQIDYESLIGRDLVVRAPAEPPKRTRSLIRRSQARTVLVRGPIKSFVHNPYFIEIRLFWTAVYDEPLGRWLTGTLNEISFVPRTPQTNPNVLEDGTIRFKIRLQDFGVASVLPPGDSLSVFDVIGLEAYLEITEENLFDEPP